MRKKINMLTKFDENTKMLIKGESRVKVRALTPLLSELIPLLAPFKLK